MGKKTIEFGKYPKPTGPRNHPENVRGIPDARSSISLSEASAIVQALWPLIPGPSPRDRDILDAADKWDQGGPKIPPAK